jgi:ubiquinone/menaquinone biosynthesis C-methylase UbiE
MKHEDHVHLLRKGVLEPGGIWADLGCGEGAFTLALADLLGPGSTIYAVDKNAQAIERLEQAMRAMFPAVTLHCLVADFTQPLNLPTLDGIVMANSLHYVRKKEAMLQRVHGYLRSRGSLLLVEYNTDRSNFWLPYPLSYEAWSNLADRNSFRETHLLEKVPSRYVREMYSAASRTN